MSQYDNGHTVGSIAQLYNDSDYINEQSKAWNEQVKTVYTTVAELKNSWAGEFSKRYTDAVEDVQPELVDFANQLSVYAATLGTVSNMYKTVEAGGSATSAERIEPNKFSLTETGTASTENEVTFDPDQCKEKAGVMNEAADKIESIIEDVGDRINAINGNYSSPNGTELIHKVMEMREAAPNYINAIKECSDCLINVVAPQYQAIENMADVSSVQ